MWLSPEKSRPLRVSGNTAFHYKTDISTYEHYITSYINTVLQIVYAPWKLQGVFSHFSVFQCYWLTSSLWQAENKFSVKSFLKSRGTGVTALIRFLLHFQITIFVMNKNCDMIHNMYLYYSINLEKRLLLLWLIALIVILYLEAFIQQ